MGSDTITERKEIKLAHLEIEAYLDRWTQELGREGHGCHGWPHSPQELPRPHLGHHHAFQKPAPRLRGNKLNEALSALMLEQLQERRSILLALGEREQFHSERLTRIERHEESQLGMMTLRLILMSRQLRQTASARSTCPRLSLIHI